MVTIFVSLLNLAGIVFSLFMWMWGFNYCCSLVAPLERTTALSKQELFEFGIEIAENLNTTELTVFDDVSSYDNDIVEIGQAVEKQIRMHDIKVWGNPKLRILELTGKLRRLGIAGFYFPFTGQAYVDNTFLATTRNFIIAHELSHSYGIASEAEADFIAYLALKNSNLISVRARYLNYCADLELLRSIRYQLYLLEDAIRLELDSKLNENILTELKAIKLNAAEYPEYFPGMQSTVNDKYLKLMGIEEGVMNYDRFIDLAWEYHHRAR